MNGWNDFFNDVIEKTPQRVKHENVLGNIHPNEAGKWIWHISMRLGAS